MQNLLSAFFPTSPLSKEHTRKYTHVHVNLETAELFRLIHEAQSLNYMQTCAAVMMKVSNKIDGARHTRSAVRLIRKNRRRVYN